MNQKNKIEAGAANINSKAPGRPTIASDDVRQGWMTPKPQYVVLMEAGWPSNHPAPVSHVVGLKKRRVDEVKAEKTFSVQGADMELVDLMRSWCRSNNITIKSFFESAIFEKLEKVGAL